MSLSLGRAAQTRRGLRSADLIGGRVCGTRVKNPHRWKNVPQGSPCSQLAGGRFFDSAAALTARLPVICIL